MARCQRSSSLARRQQFSLAAGLSANTGLERSLLASHGLWSLLAQTAIAPRFTRAFGLYGSRLTFTNPQSSLFVHQLTIFSNPGVITSTLKQRYLVFENNKICLHIPLTQQLTFMLINICV